ncbi:hypothetical protein LINPERPRIM_LOCUS37777 [Linum perenne]
MFGKCKLSISTKKGTTLQISIEEIPCRLTLI